MKVITIRLDEAVLKKLPRPSLKGRRTQWIRDAINEKLAKEKS